MNWERQSTVSRGGPKLIIQIPCFNEEQTLGIALTDLPRRLEGIGCIEWLIIDDGSTDRTVGVAKEFGVDHIVRLGRNRGLAKAFTAGLEASLKAGADIVINTDADNQYCAADIPKLLRPILEGKAEMVIGARPIQNIGHFSPLKKLLQRVGSYVVRKVSGADVRDAPSGFRALTRNAAMQLHVFSRYSYTLETLIQAGQKGISVVSVPIRVNGELRPSRLMRSTTEYVFRSVQTIIRIFALYRPFRFFVLLGALLFVLGMAGGVRWLWLYAFEYESTGRVHLPSLIATAVLLIAAVQVWVLAFIADLMRANRVMLENIEYYVRTQETRPADTIANVMAVGGVPPRWHR